MNIQDLTLCCLASHKDKDLIHAWLDNHDGLTETIIFGKDGNFDIDTSERQSKIIQIDTPLNNDFANARNSILQEVKTPLCAWLDADELLVPGTRPIIQDLGQQIQQRDSYYGGISVMRLNVFARHFVDFPNYHPFMFLSTLRYKNNALGAHETPMANLAQVSQVQILHLKHQWINFRSKGYNDANQKQALDNLQTKIDRIR